MDKFKALWADVNQEGKVLTEVKMLSKDDLPKSFSEFLAGQMKGRILVKIMA